MYGALCVVGYENRELTIPVGSDSFVGAKNTLKWLFEGEHLLLGLELCFVYG